MLDKLSKGVAWVVLGWLLLGWQQVESSSPEETVFKPGTIPLADDGTQVAAHEGWMLQVKRVSASRYCTTLWSYSAVASQVEDTWLWYGSSSKKNMSGASGSSDWLSDSVQLYVSHDLANWHKKATVFTTAALPAAWRQQKARVNAAGPYRLERPKVLYSSARRYYVLIFHLDNIDSSLGEVGYAVSVSPYGPFSFEASSKPDGLSSSHLTVAVADGGNAYLARSVPGAGVSISKLASDYLDTTGVCTSLSVQPAAAAGPTEAQQPTEAVPALFTFRGRWYLWLTHISKHKSRWLSGPSDLYVSNSSSLCGAGWMPLKRPAAGPGSATTFDSQPAFVFSFTFPGSSQVLLIYYGDRWNLLGPGSVANASYVWLPLVPDGDEGLKLVDPGQQWRLGDYRNPSLLTS